MSHFEPSRPDGRSDRRVILDMIGTAVPDTVYTHEQVKAALAVGIDKPIPMSRVYAAMGHAKRALQANQDRSISVVPGTGYRIIKAEEHLAVSFGYQSKADRQIANGISVLKHCNLDELDENHRRLHTGQLLVMSGMHQMIRNEKRRGDKLEEIIKNLAQRVDRMESEGSGGSSAAA